MESMFDLTGRVALVTGSAQGLGFEMAKGLTRAGAHVLVNGRDKDHVANAVSVQLTYSSTPPYKVSPGAV